MAFSSAVAGLALSQTLHALAPALLTKPQQSHDQSLLAGGGGSVLLVAADFGSGGGGGGGGAAAAAATGGSTVAGSSGAGAEGVLASDRLVPFGPVGGGPTFLGGILVMVY